MSIMSFFDEPEKCPYCQQDMSNVDWRIGKTVLAAHLDQSIQCHMAAVAQAKNKAKHKKK